MNQRCMEEANLLATPLWQQAYVVQSHCNLLASDAMLMLYPVRSKHLSV